MKLSQILNQTAATVEPGGSRADDVPIGTLSNAVGLPNMKWLPLDGRTLNQYQYPALTQVLLDMGKPLVNIASFNTDNNGFIIAHNRENTRFTPPAGVTHPMYLRRLAYSPDGTMLAAAYAEVDVEVHTQSQWFDAPHAVIVIYNTADWSVNTSFTPWPHTTVSGSNQQQLTGKSVQHLEFSPDGQYLFIGSSTRRLSGFSGSLRRSSALAVRVGTWDYLDCAYTTTIFGDNVAPRAYGPGLSEVCEALHVSQDSHYLLSWGSTPISYTAGLNTNSAGYVYVVHDISSLSYSAWEELTGVMTSTGSFTTFQGGWQYFSPIGIHTLEPKRRVLLIGKFQGEFDAYPTAFAVYDIENGVWDLNYFREVPAVSAISRTSGDGRLLLKLADVPAGERDPQYTAFNTHRFTDDYRLALFDPDVRELDLSYAHPNVAGLEPLFFIDFGSVLAFGEEPFTSSPLRMFRTSDWSEISNSDFTQAQLLPTLPTAQAFWQTYAPLSLSPDSSHIAIVMGTDQESYSAGGVVDGIVRETHIYRGLDALNGIVLPVDNAVRRVFADELVRIKYQL